jgi:hypothetical protein
VTKIRHGFYMFGARHLPLRLGGFHDPTCSAMANGGFRPPQDAANGYKWELSNINEDDSQDIDLAAKRPDELRQMQEIFTMEATRDNVLPLDSTVLPRLKRPGLVLAED